MAIDIAELDIPVRLKLLEQAKRDLNDLGRQGSTVARDIERSFSTASTATSTLNSNANLTTRQFTRLAFGANQMATAMSAGRLSVQGLSNALLMLGPSTGGVGAALAGLSLVVTLVHSLGTEAEATEDKVRSLAGFSEGRLRGIVDRLEEKQRGSEILPGLRMGGGLTPGEATDLAEARAALAAFARAEREAAEKIAERRREMEREVLAQLTVIPAIGDGTSALTRIISAQEAHAEAMRKTSAETAAVTLSQFAYNQSLAESERMLAELDRKMSRSNSAPWKGNGGLSGAAVGAFVGSGGSVGGLISLASAIPALGAAAAVAGPLISSLADALFGVNEQAEALRRFNDAMDDMRFNLSGPSSLDRELRRITDEFNALREAAMAARGGDPRFVQYDLNQRLREIDELERQAIEQARAAEAAQKMADAMERATDRIEALERTISDLQRFRGGLSLNPQLTILSPMQQLAEARRQYEEVLAAAQGGDQNAAGRLGGAAQAFLTASRSVNASGRGYVADFLRVQSETGAVEEMFRDQLSIQEQMLEELKRIAENTKKAGLDLPPPDPSDPTGRPFNPFGPGFRPPPPDPNWPGFPNDPTDPNRPGGPIIVIRSPQFDAAVLDELRRLRSAVTAMTN